MCSTICVSLFYLFLFFLFIFHSLLLANIRTYIIPIYYAINFIFDVPKFKHLRTPHTQTYMSTHMLISEKKCWTESAGIVSSLIVWFGVIVLWCWQANMKFETIISSGRRLSLFVLLYGLSRVPGSTHSYTQHTHTHNHVLELWNLTESHKKQCCHSVKNVVESAAQGLTWCFLYAHWLNLVWFLLFAWC